MSRLLLIFVFLSSFIVHAGDDLVTVDPNEIKMNRHVHETFSEKFLQRIKSTTDTFEIVDGISFEKAVDLYKRDLNPEENLVIWEEMARVYAEFCKSRCQSAGERKEVYRALLLRSMFSSEESLARLEPKVLSIAEAKTVIAEYKLEAKPIGVIQN